MAFLPLILIFIVFYFLLIRPQQQRVRAQQQQQATIAEGDDVLSQGGIYGRVTQTLNDRIWVEVAPNVELVFDRRSLTKLDDRKLEAFAAEDAESEDGFADQVPNDLSELESDHEQLPETSGESEHPSHGGLSGQSDEVTTDKSSDEINPEDEKHNKEER